MGKSSAPKTQTITEKNDPWEGAQPYLRQALGAASQEFGRGAPQFYPGQTVAPMSQQTLGGANALGAGAAMSPQLANQGINWLGQAAAPRFNPGQFNIAGQAQGGFSNPALAPMAGLAQQPLPTWGMTGFAQGGGANPFLQNLTQVAGQQPQGAGHDALTFAATGGLAQPNPYLDQYFERGANAIRNQVDTAFNRAGRGFSSGNYADALSENLGNYAADLYGSAYDTGINRGLSAASQLAGYEQGGVDRMLGAVGQQAGLAENQFGRQLGAQQFLSDFGLGARGQSADIWGRAGGLYGQDLAQQLAAYQALANQGNTQAAQQMTAAGLLGGMYDLGQRGAADQLAAGGIFDQYNQQLLNSDIERWNYNQNANRANIEWLNAIATGAGSLGGTVTGQQPYQPGNPFLQGLGALGSIASVATMFSDRRLKTDVAWLDRDPRGFNWYRFRYLWDDPQLSRVGVMADEVEDVLPGAVHYDDEGYAMVDYAQVMQ